VFTPRHKTELGAKIEAFSLTCFELKVTVTEDVFEQQYILKSNVNVAKGCQDPPFLFLEEKYTRAFDDRNSSI
jgi:hypothetical protein